MAEMLLDRMRVVSAVRTARSVGAWSMVYASGVEDEPDPRGSHVKVL